MSEINYDKLRDSLSILEKSYNDYLEYKDNSSFDNDMHESIKESCIQRFEVCIDISRRHLRKYLEEEGITNISSKSNDIFREAASAHAVSDAETWIDFNKKRGDTSHDYCGDKAKVVFEIIPDFIKEVIDLYETISGKKWRN